MDQQLFADLKKLIGGGRIPRAELLQQFPPDERVNTARRLTSLVRSGAIHSEHVNVRGKGTTTLYSLPA